MSDDDPPPPSTDAASDPPQNSSTRRRQQTAQKHSLFAVPAPLKRIFDQYPLITYAENELPVRSTRRRDGNVLYLFTTEEAARDGKPSFNPACLKWQTYLKLSGIDFKTVSSNNHASPSGALPFLLPAWSREGGAKTLDPIASNKLRRWISSQSAASKTAELENIRYEVYSSLLENNIRKAWLYELYLTPANSRIVHRLYIAASSSNPFVQTTIAYQLRRAAETELTKASNTIVENDIMRDADDAFAALSALMGQDEWFFAQPKPSLFDASVFSYTHLILDEGMGWEANTLAEQLRRYENLVQHRERIMEMYF